MIKRCSLLTATFAIAVILSMPKNAFTQNLEIGLKGSYKSTWLFNKNVSDRGDIADYAAGWGYNYGLGATFYFNSKLGFGVDGLLNLHSGNYAGTMDSNRTYTSDVKINSLEIPVLFKLRNATGAFFEVGPQIGLVSGARYDFFQHYTNGSGMNIDNDTTFNVTSTYSGTNISAVLGFGISIKLVSRLALKTGIRLEYGLTDLKGVDSFGEDFRNFFFYPSPETTNSAAGSLFVNLTWTFGPQDNGGSPPPPPPPPNN
jgi:hypothetical protein